MTESELASLKERHQHDVDATTILANRLHELVDENVDLYNSRLAWILLAIIGWVLFIARVVIGMR